MLSSFTFLSTGLSQSYDYDCGVRELTRVDSILFFFFLNKYFFQFCPSTLSRLIIEIHSFI